MRNKLLLTLSVICVLSLSACNIEVKKDNANEASTNSKIRNGIELKEDGLKVEQAFLLKDDGTLIDENNKTQVGERVSLRLIIHGWEVKNGKVFLDASEQMATNTNQVFLNEKSLFASSIPDGTAPENAEAITLFATISQLDKLYDYFVVSFKVWDKISNKSVSGSYKLYL